jgi:xanthine/uracil/vitamin C permease (AzgA family)
VLIAAIEAIAGLAVLVADVIAVVQGTQGLSGAGSGTEVAGVVLWLILVAGLGLVWFGLFRRRRLGLAPFLLVQAFVLVVVPLFLGSDRAAYRFVGVALGLMAVVGVILGLRPSARAALH